ncbi:glycosyltransferase [Tabrizicola sp.]|uniref:glycosyltransferase family protein n=1 Tax=Tabrizicola sp. TaxID=2005166 RepID=UPI002869EDC7|nr:glycosyltransferase [Tabrizicola sp.]
MRSIARKIRGEKRVVPEPGFPMLGTVHYFEWLEAFHREARPKVYLEVGTESGASLSFADCVSFAVDPAFALQADVSRNKPELHQFQGTSDAFFASGMVEKLGYRVDLAFLDGMHHFEFLLRDFMNVERLMAPGGTILMHDCVPFSHAAADRDWDLAKTKSWTGDVWKLIPILREHRPDLEVRVLDLLPSGLVAVTKTDPDSATLREMYDDLVAGYASISLTDFGLDRFAALLDLVPIPPAAPVPAPAPVGRWNGPAEPVLRVAIKTCVPVPEESATWGDFHFATGLATGLRKAGHATRIDTMAEWADAEGPADIDLVLHGGRSFAPRPGVRDVHWVLYPLERRRKDLLADLKGATCVFVASEVAVQDLAAALPGTDVQVLMQAFDETVMYADDTVRDDSIVFVGARHRAFAEGRPIVDWAVTAGVQLRIWGQNWKGHAAHSQLVAPYLPNEQLGDLYRRAGIVLCDHMPQMRDAGYVSNRIFDALACAAPVICDDLRGLPAEFRPFVTQCRSAEELVEGIAAIRRETPAKRKKRQAFAATMRERHSFTVRARQLSGALEKVTALAGPKSNGNG